MGETERRECFSPEELSAVISAGLAGKMGVAGIKLNIDFYWEPLGL